jgi:hypothetical protein
MKFFGYDKASSFVKCLGPPVKCSFSDLVSNVFEALENMFDFGEQVSKGEDLTSILNKMDNITGIIDEVAELRSLENLTYTGIPVNGKIDIRNYFLRIKDCMERGELVKSVTPSRHRSYVTLTTSLNQLRALRASTQMKVEGGMRQTPYCILIHGDPEVGKSKVLIHICKAFSKARGRVFNRTHMFSRNSSDQYMSGYDALSNPIFHYSELGSLHKSIASKQGDPILREYLSVCDSLPMRANMAELSEKGMLVCPEMVILDCNDPELNADVTCNNPAAIRRRPIYIDVTVKHDVRKDGFGTLDRQKAKQLVEEGRKRMDMYNFDVYRMVPQSNKISQKEMIHRGIDIFALTKFIYHDTIKHMNEQQDASRAEDETIDGYMDSEDFYTPLSPLSIEDTICESSHTAKSNVYDETKYMHI